MNRKSTSIPIAVVGLGCCYPGSRSPRQLWENILSRRRQFRRFPDCRLPLAEYFHEDIAMTDKAYARQAALIDGFEFDWSAKRIPKSTYEATDIVHWLALETALGAIADAEISAGNFPGRRTGVIVGNSLTGEQSRSNSLRLRWPFVRKVFLAAAQQCEMPATEIRRLEDVLEANYKSVFPAVNEDTLAGGLSNTIAGRICNFLNADGGGYTVDGACSSSLLAITTAAAGLANADLDLALAGGVDISLDPFELIGFSKTKALAAGEMTVYDRRGSGFIPGEGCGFVVLKRHSDALKDRNYVYAVLHGWGISSDGSHAALTAPSVPGQALALERAYTKAGYGIHDLNFIEGHGTGTAVGDRIELEAIAAAFDDSPQPQGNALRFCGISSLKSIMGHTKAASGVGGFIKAVMAVNRRISPPTAGCRYPNSTFEETASGLYPIQHGIRHEPTQTLRAGISAMGFGGINCHVTIASADPPRRRLEPALDERALMVSAQEDEIFIFSGDNASKISATCRELSETVKGISLAELTDLAAHLGNQETPGLPWRAAFTAGSPDEVRQKLQKLQSHLSMGSVKPGAVFQDAPERIWIGHAVKPPRIGLLFPGQGSQKLNMAQILVERFQWAREIVQNADHLSAEFEAAPISQIVFPPTDRARDPRQVDAWFRTLSLTANAQPAVCLASILWFKFLQNLGIVPVAVGGHSLGEATAFYAAGAFDETTLLRFAFIRGQAMTPSQNQAGAMLSLKCSRGQVDRLLSTISDGFAVLANINAIDQMVVSGDVAAIEQIRRLADAERIATRLLPVSNAFHNPLMETAAERLGKNMPLPPRLANPKMRVFKGTDGREVIAEQDLPHHFIHQITAQIQLPTLVESMANVCDIIIEAGPGQVLTGLVNSASNGHVPICMPTESSSLQTGDLNRLLARLFVGGTTINWDKLYANRLVRPFVAPEDKSFFKNPCETPLVDSDVDRQASQGPITSETKTILSELAGVSHETISKYLKKRGQFLADVIKADLKHSFIEEELGERTDRNETVAGVEISLAEKNALANPLGAEQFYTMIVAATGFPRETLTPDLRLLDDLNLDSIKSGDLIAGYAEKLGIAEQVDPASLANATIDEIVALFDRLSSPQNSRSPKDGGLTKQDVLRELVQFVARISEHPMADISIHAPVGSHLGLGADHLEELLQEISGRFHLDLNIDLDPLIDRSVSQIAEIIVRIAKVGKPATRKSSTNLPYPWVREFQISLVEREQTNLPPWFGKRTEDQWSRAQVLILGDDSRDSFCRALGDHLIKEGAGVRCHSYDTAASRSFREGVERYSHFIAVLPRTCREPEQAEDRLKAIIKRLVSAAIPPPASRGRRRRNCLAFVQFGDGYFGTRSAADQLSRCCASALAKSVHLERHDLKTRVLDFDPTLAEAEIAAKTISEMQGPENFAEVGYDRLLARRTFEAVSLQPKEYKLDSASWSPDDVIIVTGGAKGITSECALALARATGVRMALIGRTPLRADEEHVAQDEKILSLIQRYERHGLEVRYYSCDVCDRKLLKKTLQRIRQDLGKITGFIHGAGLNIPRRIHQATAEDALTEVSPKVIGALNLLAEFSHDPPKIIVGLTSVIGITGMPGNSWYAFSNEALDLILRGFRAEHPQTRTQSVAYSVWRDEGMGAKLGSVAALKIKGIEAIPTDEGVRRFVRLFLHNPGAHQVIVAARMAPVETLAMRTAAPIKGARYLEKLLQHIPGVESAFMAHLSAEQDLYLQDHCFNGSYLFPTVFGLEAMSQVVAHVAGISEFHRVRIENLQLRRPITVDPEKGADIVIYAHVQESDLAEDRFVIKAGIFKLGMDSESDLFLARFVLGRSDRPAVLLASRHRKRLNIDPADLYRHRLLFQGPRFQRIDKVYQLDQQGPKSGTVVVGTSSYTQDPGQLAFANTETRRLMLGDPFQRDALLQSPALMIPQDTSLPISVKCWDIYRCGPDLSAQGGFYIQTRVEAAQEDKVNTAVTFFSNKNDLIENLEGYHLKILQHHADYPTVADLLEPDDHDTATLQKHLTRLTHATNLKLPHVGLAFLPGIHDLSKSGRRELEHPLLEKTVQKATGHTQPAEGQVQVSWQSSGKPVVALAKETLEVSLAHDHRYCIAAVAERPVGCDIAPVTHRSLRQWKTLLGPVCRPLIDDQLDADTLDLQCTSLWAAREALQKLGITNVKSLSEEQRAENGTVLYCDTDHGVRKIVTFPILLTRGKQRVIALSVLDFRDQTTADNLPEVHYPGYGDLFDQQHYKVIEGGPQGQVTFIHRFPVTFHPAGQLSRHIYFSHYFFWAGMVREASAWPILKKISNQFSTGKWGGVTNFADLRVLGEASTHDLIEVWMWSLGNSGPQNSTTELTFDFRKVLPGNSYERLALLDLKTTWVRILDHGIVKVEPYPDYYASFLKDMQPRFDAPNTPQKIPEPLDGLYTHDDEAYLYTSPAGPVVEPVLHAELIDTSLEDANIAGNIYFANYYAWQGRVRDRYFYNLVPEYFQGVGKYGEIICLDCRVDHLREAMPFDRIEVSMSLKMLKTSRATFHFDYLKILPDGRNLKLATGEQTVVWVRRDADRKPVPHPFPPAVRRALHESFTQELSKAASF
ncbi:Polyketide synthase [Olavius algarvensis Delta 1 endosymbiont]|nr:Polyketide synthase [Olavius algarvensis Delta 1 endosymbiont]